MSQVPQQHNAPQVHKDPDGLDLPPPHVDANERPQAHCAQSTMKPTRALGLTLGTVRLELFGNLTAHVYYYSYYASGTTV